MTRTLIAFGDSHTSGAEIDIQYSEFCHEKAYPSHIANHYGFDCLNFGQSGGSNLWILKRFYEVMPELVEKGIPLFVLCNFTDVGRMFFKWEDSWFHFTPGDLNQLNGNSKFSYPEEPLLRYKEYLINNSDIQLTQKTLLIIKKIQNFCKDNNIPFVFHTSVYWFDGNWKEIDKRNFLGHHDSDKTFYYPNVCNEYAIKYSYWGLATHHPMCKHLQYEDRWHMHYPEPYHKYWAKVLINFIDNQKLLEGYI